MDFWNVVAAAAAVLSIATVTGIGLQRGKVTNLRGDLSDAYKKIEVQRSEIDDQRGELDALKGERAADKATIAKQGQDIALLQRVATGEVNWQAISDQLEHHHARAEQNWSTTTELLAEILDELRRPR